MFSIFCDLLWWDIFNFFSFFNFFYALEQDHNSPISPQWIEIIVSISWQTLENNNWPLFVTGETGNYCFSKCRFSYAFYMVCDILVKSICDWRDDLYYFCGNFRSIWWGYGAKKKGGRAYFHFSKIIFCDWRKHKILFFQILIFFVTNVDIDDLCGNDAVTDETIFFDCKIIIFRYGAEIVRWGRQQQRNPKGGTAYYWLERVFLEIETITWIESK